MVMDINAQKMESTRLLKRSLYWKKIKKKDKNIYKYGKKENNIRQFYTWYYLLCPYNRTINAGRKAQRSVITFLFGMAYRLYDLSVS